MGKLLSLTAEIKTLSKCQKEAMWQLMDTHYENSDHERFIRDLSEKSHVILLTDSGNGQVRGFSTVKRILTEVSGRPVCAVFSGDTIIDPEFWGEQGLVRGFGSYLLKTMELFPNHYCCWFLISKGYKTYRYLPLYFNDFFPCFNRPTPEFEQEALNVLANGKYGKRYDPKTGIIRMNGKADWLRSGVADVTNTRLENPHIRFFVEKNPGYAVGDELVCIAHLSNANLKKIFFKIVNSNSR